jgi:hypothetical protein
MTQNTKYHPPNREFRTASSAPLDGILHVPFTHIAYPFITPTATDLAILLKNSTHSEVTGPANNYNGRG